MAADLSRVRHHPLLDYAGVELKQGAVLLDADANELVAILDRRLRALASDVLGRSTVSQTTPDAFRLTVVAGVLRIGIGRLYVDGLLAENHGSGADSFDALLAEPTRSTPTPLTAQPYLPVPLQPPTAGRHLVYLDVWQRELTHLENPALVETAIGVETSSRLQTVWQVRLLSEIPADTACGSELEAWNALTAPSSGRLSSGTFDVPPAADPCELPPTGGYRGLENQLYRVEIHDAGQPGGDATFKWSRENASVGSRVASVISASELELDSLGRDEVLGIADGDWVEITDDHREFALQAGEMRRVSLANPDTRRITLSAALPGSMLPGSFPDSTLATARNLRVRRWDQRGAIFRTGSNVPIQNLDANNSTGVIRMPAAGVDVLLENGVTVSFSSTGAPGFKTGDHWVFAARTADASVEELVAAPPRGVHHHHARLGLWDVGAGAVTDCRTPWPPSGEGDCGCTECVTPASHASGQLTIQAAVDRVRDGGGTVCLHAGLYPLREPVRVAGARSLAIRGQGAATVITAQGTAFQIEGAAGLVIEKLSVISLGAQSAITARAVAGLRLSELALVVVGANDGNGAGIGLQGLCAGVAIRDNLIVAPDGIRSERSVGQASPLVLTAALQVRDNVLWCRRRGLSLEGAVAHLFGHRVEDNEVLGCRDGGLAALGFALPGASMRICGNTLSVNGPGIECGVDGAWIEGNKLNATRQGERAPTGSAIVLAAGLDPTGSDQAQVLANQISGFADAGVLVSAPVRDLICKLNIIENCGAGIVMGDDAEASAVSIENNHIRDIRGTGVLAAAGLAVGIGVARAAAATVAGNQVRRVALAAANSRFVAGIFMLGVERSRIHGNEVSEIGPRGDFSGIGAGILVATPYAECDVARNQVERDADPQANAGESAWAALLIADAGIFGTTNLAGTTAGATTAAAGAPGAASAAGATVNRTANTTTVRVDDRRTLLISGNRVSISTARSDFIGTIAGAATAAVQGGAASVQGNTFAARGRAPAVFVVASAEALFSDNRCTHQGTRGLPAVVLSTPVALLNANRVRSGDVSIAVIGSRCFTALGNITTGVVRINNNPLAAPWAALNVVG